MKPLRILLAASLLIACSPAAWAQAAPPPARFSTLPEVRDTSRAAVNVFRLNIGGGYTARTMGEFRTDLGIDTDDAVTFGSALVGNGSAAAPAYSFASDTSSGLTLTATGPSVMSLVAGGVRLLSVSSGGVIQLYDFTDNTKSASFDLTGITAGQNVVLTVPNAAATLVGTDTTQTLTNKTISGASNTLTAIAPSSITGTAAILGANSFTGNQTFSNTGTGITGHGGSSLTFASGEITALGRLTAKFGSNAAQNIIFGDVTSNGGYPGIWFGIAPASASYTNYSFLFDASLGTTVFNSGTALNFRIGNNTQFAVISNAIRSASGTAIGFSSTATGGGALAANDAAFSRISAGIVGLGTGAVGSVAGTLQLTTLTASGSVTIGGGTAIASVRSASASVDFASTADGATDTRTISVTSAVTTNTPGVQIGGALPAGWDLVNAYVSAADTVTIIARNRTGGVSDPAAVTLRAVVIGF